MSPRLVAELVLVGCTIVWGLTFVTVKDALVDADALTFLALRFGLGAVALLLAAGRQLAMARVWRRGGVLGVLLFVGYWCQTEGLVTTTPSRSAFITGLTVVAVPFVDWGFYGRRPAPIVVAMACLALVGLGVLTSPEQQGGFGRGEALTLACAAVYAVHIAMTGRYASEGGARGLVGVQLLVVAVLSAVARLAEPSRLVLTPRLVGAIALTGLVASAMAISFQTWAQARTTTTRAALIFALEPVVAAIAAAAWGEPMTAHTLIGGALIVGALVCVELLGARAEAPKSARSH